MFEKTEKNAPLAVAKSHQECKDLMRATIKKDIADAEGTNVNDLKDHELDRRILEGIHAINVEGNDNVENEKC